MRLALLALFAVFPSVFAVSGFISTCENVSLSGSTLHATCINEGGGAGGSSLDLNRCITNNNGEMFCQFGGSAFGSCRDCRLGGSELTCTCTRANQQTDVSSIDLNGCVGNLDGVLAC
ncbi:Cyanovirin-N [Exidia glandulosa HHB12029]|uniref:Cyanovirin-N n=1 Tax=Exidia glandulosa HHB12029 TaxID=1314781 RepID=A0A165NHM1_EXIGL|nr:Cyanovirin-N [Exidia glandulosa HHB12029]